MNILVSSCLVGENCKYNGGNNKSEKIITYLEERKEKGDIIYDVCPEILNDIPCPREPVEISCGKVIRKDGKDVDTQYKKAVQIAIDLIKSKNINVAILKSKSPTCGVKEIYDGSFSRTLISGKGIFADELLKLGITLIDSDDI
ncbi:MAG: DUF523 domain-containing protein [Clostridia bacterium]